MDVLNAAHPLRGAFSPCGVAHCSTPSGGVLVSRNKAVGGAYTVDLYVKGSSADSGSLTFVALSKGHARSLGLPTAPFGTAWPDGDPLQGLEAVHSVYTNYQIDHSFSSTVSPKPGIEPNDVTIVVHTSHRSTDAGSDHQVARYHRHAYSAADWLLGVYKRSAGANPVWTGGVAATKEFPIPMSRREFWERYATGAVAGISNSDARARILEEAAAYSWTGDMEQQATMCLDFYWDAATGTVYAGRGMGSFSEIAPSDPFIDNYKAAGVKVVNSAFVQPTVRVINLGQTVSAFATDGGALCIPEYNMSYRVPVNNCRVFLTESASSQRVLAELTRLCSEVFPASLATGEVPTGVAHIYWDEVFAAAVETALDQVVNYVQPQGTATPSEALESTIAVGEEWRPVHADFTTECMFAFASVLRAASDG